MAQIISHWHALVDGFSTSSLDFYDAVEAVVRAREVPDATFSRVYFAEGTVVSAKREYLRVERGKLAFDICAAPYGTGFFFSWWLVRPGPRYPFLWPLAFFVLTTLWLLMLLSSLSRSVTASAFGSSDGGSGCLFVMLLLGVPAVLFGIGWGIREGHFGVESEDVLAIPVVGWLYERFFDPMTYYTSDTALMFQEAVARAVGEVIDSLLSAQGLRALTEDDRKPSIRDLAR